MSGEPLKIDDNSGQDELHEGHFSIDYNHGENDASNQITPLMEQDRFLPIANISRIIKRVVPDNGKVAKDAKECVQECVSEFISFITSEASERCQLEKRKTINGEDLLYAMQALGFDNYVEPLKLYLAKYREALKGDKVVPCGLTSDDLKPSSSMFADTEGPNGVILRQLNDACGGSTNIPIRSATATANIIPSPSVPTSSTPTPTSSSSQNVPLGALLYLDGQPYVTMQTTPGGVMQLIPVVTSSVEQ